MGVDGFTNTSFQANTTCSNHPMFGLAPERQMAGCPWNGTASKPRSLNCVWNVGLVIAQGWFDLEATSACRIQVVLGSKGHAP